MPLAVLTTVISAVRFESRAALNDAYELGMIEESYCIWVSPIIQFGMHLEVSRGEAVSVLGKIGRSVKIRSSYGGHKPHTHILILALRQLRRYERHGWRHGDRPQLFRNARSSERFL